MKVSSPVPRALLVTCALTGLLLADCALAAPVALPDALSYQYFGLNYLINVQSSNVVGTLDYTGQPGCGGVCSATTQLGTSPSVSATVNEVTFEGSALGVVQASLAYYVEYLDAPGTYTVNLHSIDSLLAPDGASVSAHLQFGPAGLATATFNNFDSVTLDEKDCVNGCPPPGFLPTAVPFAPDQQVQILANTPYLVQLDLMFRPLPTNTQISGAITGPLFTTASGGQFIFSPGVASPVPLPAAAWLLLSGLGGLGAVARRRLPRRIGDQKPVRDDSENLGVDR